MSITRVTGEWLKYIMHVEQWLGGLEYQVLGKCSRYIMSINLTYEYITATALEWIWDLFDNVVLDSRLVCWTELCLHGQERYKYVIVSVEGTHIMYIIVGLNVTFAIANLYVKKRYRKKYWVIWRLSQIWCLQ